MCELCWEFVLLSKDCRNSHTYGTVHRLGRGIVQISNFILYFKWHIRRATRRRRKTTTNRIRMSSFVSDVMERFGKIMDNKNAWLRFRATLAIQQRLYLHLLSPTCSEWSYKLAYEYGQCYIGQTGRTIKQRITEHERDVRLKKIWHSTVPEHIHETGHIKDFRITEVITITMNYQRKSLSIDQRNHRGQEE